MHCCQCNSPCSVWVVYPPPSWDFSIWLLGIGSPLGPMWVPGTVSVYSFGCFPSPPKELFLTYTCLSALSWVLEGDPLTSESSVCAAFSSPGSISPWALHSISTGILSALLGFLFSWRGFGSTLQAISWGNPCPLVCSPVRYGSPSFATCCSISGKQLFHIFGLLFYIFCLVPATSSWLSIEVLVIILCLGKHSFYKHILC